MTQLPVEIATLFNDPTKISAKSILGDWVTADSIPLKVKFEEKQHELVLVFNDHRTYRFEKDNPGRIGVLGLQMQWPPQYCHITRLNGNELMLTLFTLSTQHANYYMTIFQIPKPE